MLSLLTFAMASGLLAVSARRPSMTLTACGLAALTVAAALGVRSF